VAGKLIFDTIQDGSGNTIATTNAIKGTAKTWVVFDGGNGYPVQLIRNSLNVSSVTRVSAGAYRVNFTKAFPDVNFAVVATSNDNGSGAGCLTLLTETYPSNVSFLSINPASLAQTDAAYVSIVFFR
jgi:hypothetical protein